MDVVWLVSCFNSIAFDGLWTWHAVQFMPQSLPLKQTHLQLHSFNLPAWPQHLCAPEVI